VLTHLPVLGRRVAPASELALDFSSPHSVLHLRNGINPAIYVSMLHKQIPDLAIEGVAKDEIEAHFNLVPEPYFINSTAKEVELHLRMVNQLLSQIQQSDSIETLAPIIDWRDDNDLNMTVVNLVTWDRAGLFFKLAGALTLAGVNIHSARAISRKDNVTIDTFYIMGPEGGVVSDAEAQGIFHGHINESLIHDKRLTYEIECLEMRIKSQKELSSMPPANFRPYVEICNNLSLHRVIIEVKAGDCTGLLYNISRLIHSLGFDITFARIATERGIAMDTFYIEKINKRESIDTNDLLELRELLNALIEDTAALVL
jgi:[protein-PII] uridylyltransferase